MGWPNWNRFDVQYVGDEQFSSNINEEVRAVHQKMVAPVS
jgi:hypothetical protein